MTESILELYRARLQELLARAVRAMQQMSEEDLNWRPNEESNSVANLVIHLEGNLQHFIEHGLGGAESKRDRDNEFNERRLSGRDELIARFEAAVSRTDAVLAALPPEKLDDINTIAPFKGNTVGALLLRLTTHFAEHVGQILYIAKWRKGEAYEVQSTPHRKG